MPTDTNLPDADRPVCFAATLAEELLEIARLRAARKSPPYPNSEVENSAALNASATAVATDSTSALVELFKTAESNADRIFQCAHEASLVGLAFSGGGIRSATFNLGVLQGLAEQRILPMFDYLSTVSGGGYIGSWLAAWILRTSLAASDQNPGGHCEGPNNAVASVQQDLIPARSSKPQHSEPRPIRFLREYSNYLTPRVGALGADTWTAIAIYLRNVLLNQSILILFLAALLLLPHVIIQVSYKIVGTHFLGDSYWFGVCAAAFLAMCSLTIIAINMKNLTGRRVGDVPEFGWYSKQSWILALVVAPLFVTALIMSCWIWSHGAVAWDEIQWTGVGVVVFGLIWTLASLANLPKNGPAAPHWGTKQAWFWSVVFSFISGGVGGLLLGFITRKLLQCSDFSGNGFWHVVSFGPPAIVTVFLLVGTLQIGLMGLYFPDPRREWWARLGAYLLIVNVAWITTFTMSIYSPLGLIWLSRKVRMGVGIGWLASTLTGIFGGKSASTSATESTSWSSVALSITPYIFILGLMSIIALALEAGIAFIYGRSAALKHLFESVRLVQKAGGWSLSFDILGGKGGLIPYTTIFTKATYTKAHWWILYPSWNWWLIGLLVGFAFVCFVLSCRFNINEFSMNLFYRNRLVRAYLGASDTQRKPNPFTGFDPDDELLLRNFRSENCYAGPFPLINCALNLVSGKDLAWQQRKAESFVLTPLRCGFDTWLEQIDLDSKYSPTEKPGDIHTYGFRPTTKYGFGDRGLRLGTAISISGAAASPNMGYHSSPSLSFLMTMFNVRLGFWAGNPRHNKSWTSPGPRVGLLYLLAELFGQTDDEAKYIYLSDGGHFENLGLYELVKRRCKYVIVSDASCDGDYDFGDLANAIRKCREDVGVEIELDIDPIFPNALEGVGPDRADGAGYGEDRDEFSRWHWSVGKIKYSLVDPQADDGILVYIKPSITGDEPSDVVNYRRQHAGFPHESTGDQWFNESQFESYRRLGQHVVHELLKQPKTEGFVTPGITESEYAKHVFAELKRIWKPHAPESR